MRLLEMWPPHEFTRYKFSERKVSRRHILKLGVASVISMGLHDKEPSAFKQIGNYTADIFSHNADSLSKIENSTGIPAIEMDVTQLPDGTLVVAHDEKEYYQIPDSQRYQQNPTDVAQLIRSTGAKPHIDIKNVTDASAFNSFILGEEQKGPITVSTPHHEFLWNLHENGFEGQILFTLRDDKAVKDFLKKYKKEDFDKGSFGVSIRFTAFSEKTAKELKERGLYILAWTPNTSLGILDALKKGANGITSDMPHLLKQIGKNVPLSA